MATEIGEIVLDSEPNEETKKRFEKEERDAVIKQAIFQYSGVIKKLADR